MKTKTTITELSHEDLVNLLSTATFGSSWLSCCISQATRDKLKDLPGDCREDIWANALLNGFPIYLTEARVWFNQRVPVAVSVRIVREDGR